MFIYRSEEAVVEQLFGWHHRGDGYRPLSEPVAVDQTMPRRPHRCWVCDSTDIGHAHLKEGEVEAAMESVGSDT